MSVDDVQRVEVSDDENLEDDNEEFSNKEKYLQPKPLDPRAGRVDVELSQLPFDAAKIAQKLEECRSHPSSTSNSRRQLLRLSQEYVLRVLLIR